MRFTKACIPLGAAWSSPFARWQGPLAEVNSLDLAVDVAMRAMAARGIDASILTRLVLGWTVPQEASFYGAPTVAARLGAPGISGPTLAQACATSAVCVETAAAGVESGDAGVTLVLTTDRTSNGPLVMYPTPSATDGAPRMEHWVLDNFQHDPNTGQSMLQTAENVAEEIGATRQELDAGADRSPRDRGIDRDAAHARRWHRSIHRLRGWGQRSRDRPARRGLSPVTVPAWA